MIDDIAGIMVVNQEQECWCLSLMRSNWNVEESFQLEIHIPGYFFLPQVNESGLHSPDKRCISKYQSSKKISFIHQFYTSIDPLVCWDTNRTLTPADPHPKENKMNNLFSVLLHYLCLLTCLCIPLAPKQRCKCAHADESEELDWKPPQAFFGGVFFYFFGHFCTL